MNCSVCDIPMTYEPFHSTSSKMCWYCPCCKSRLRTAAMIQEEIQQAADAEGITPDELLDRNAAKFMADPPDPPPDIDLFVEQQAKEWVAPCSHVKNPWL